MKHRFLRARRWAIAALTGATVLGGVSFIGATAAGASTPTQDTATTSPFIGMGQTSASAGNWEFTIANISGGDTVTFQVAAPDEGNTTDITTWTNCQTGGDSVGFASVPTVTGLPESNSGTAPAATAAISTATDETTAPGDKGVHCSAQGVKDLLTITFPTSSPGKTWHYVVSNVKYATGAAAHLGQVFVALNGTPTAGSDAYPQDANGDLSNAHIVESEVTSTPTSIESANGAAPATDTPIGNITVTEFMPGAISAGFLCVYLDDGGTFDTNGNGGTQTVHTPTITVGGTGGATTTGVVTQPSSDELAVDVTKASSGGTSTFTFGNLAVDPKSDVGPDHLVAEFGGSSTCGGTTYVGDDVQGDYYFAQAYQIVDRIFGQTADDTAAAELSVTNATAQANNRAYGPINYAAHGNNAAYNCNASGTQSNSVVLATDQSFQDSLDAAYLSDWLQYNQHQGGGILVTPTNSLSGSVLAALRNNDVGTVYVVGGPLAISDQNVTNLANTPYTCNGVNEATNLRVIRIYGQTAADTAYDIATYPPLSYVGQDYFSEAYNGQYNDTSGLNGSSVGSAPTSNTKTIFVANQNYWYDAMGASAISAYEDFPIMLTDPSNLSSQVAAYIGQLQASYTNVQVIVMGGPLAVSDNVVTQLLGLGASVLRIAGSDYVDTSSKLARFAENYYDDTTGLYYGLDFGTNYALTVRGDFYTDGLTASTWADQQETPLLLAMNPSTLGSSLDSYLTDGGTQADSSSYNGVFNALEYNDQEPLAQYDGSSGVVVIGGPLAVASTTVQNAINDLSATVNAQ